MPSALSIFILEIQLSVLSYIIEISVFLPVAIAGLQFTIDGGGGESKKYQNTIPIFKTVFKRRQKMMQGNRI